ncbi:Hydrolase, alpha/beta hydrolase fold protein [Candidatus Sulfopaludibacter sp. SbA3]|nr:Hydrolase, alpha/beta hydrolase fold protein [Candidatus Sulfopaludibacter sp. SbA3]
MLRFSVFLMATLAAAQTVHVPLTACKAAGGRAEALCGKYEVFENRATKSGRQIKLNLMVLRAVDAKPEPDPVFLLAGGPGQAAVQTFQGLALQYRQKRDVVLVDQRGAGESNPLRCDLDEGVAAAFARLLPLDKLARCRDQLEKTADLRQYTTSVAMDDLDEVRAALGYERINVWGGSYGTTAGLEYLRRHGDHVRTLTLVAVIPPAYRVPLPFAHTVQKSMEALFARCAADAPCRGALPHLRAEFETVLDRLGKAPVTFRFTSPPAIQEPIEIKLSRDMFGDYLRRIPYTMQGISLMPLAIHSAYGGDFETFARLCYELSIRTQDDTPFGMYFSILCNESFPFISAEETARVSKGTYVGDFRVREQGAMCRDWPNAHVPKSFVEPVRSDRPVLLFSGEFDPAGQPEYAAEEAKYFPHSKHVISRNASHGLGGPCAMGITMRFIDSGTADGLDTSWIDEMRLPPFRLKGPRQAGMSPQLLAEFAGSYEPSPGSAYTVRADSGLLMLKAPSAPSEVALYPMSQNRLFMMVADGEVEFVRDESGVVSYLVVHTAGRAIRMMRK